MTTTTSRVHANGIDPEAFDLDDKYAKEDGVVFMNGVQAIVRLLFDQVRADRRRGVRTAAFVSGYPGSPLGGFDLALQRSGRHLTDHEITWVPGVNEDLAATAVWGSQQDHLAPLAHHDGIVGMWYGKAPGVDRCGDVFRHANFHGVGKNGGVVCAAGDDPSSKSSTLPSHSEIAFYDAMMPILVPGNVQEVLDLGRHAYELSRYSGCWSALKIVTNVADGFGTAEVGHARPSTTIPQFEIDGVPWRHVQQRRLFVPESLEMERDLSYRRHEAAKAYARQNGVNRITVNPSDAWIGIIAAGRVYHEVRQALLDLGLGDRELHRHGVRLLQLGMIYPLEEQIVMQLADGVDEVLVVEEKRGLAEQFVREILYGQARHPLLVGKRDELGHTLVPADGELASDRLLPILRARLGTRIDIQVGASTPPSALSQNGVEDHGARPVPVLLGSTRATAGGREPVGVGPSDGHDDLPLRTAHFCSGCPHNRSTIDVSGSPVGGGVGCHAMVLWMDRGVTSYTHMGGEGAQWIGRSPFTATTHMVQNMGDGTFFHSGSLAVRAAVAARVNVTFKLLHNGVVAMTGGQEPTGQMSVPRLCSLLLVEGVTRVIVCSEDPSKYSKRSHKLPGTVTLWSRDRLEDAERLLAATPGVTVLIYDQECAAETRRLRKRGKMPERRTRVFINESVCEGCGDCGVKSSCLSVHPVDTEFGRKTRIHQSSCNTDYSCLDGDCPSFVTVKTPRRKARTRPQDSGKDRTAPALPSHLPRPNAKAELRDGGFNLYLVGVGGTGVVTVNQVLATAALLEGLEVVGLDQTGLSQKGGPVVSHLRLLAEQTDGSNTITPGGADCLLAFDLLVAVDQKHRLRADPDRTVTIASTTAVPTATMVMDAGVRFPDVATLTDILGGISRPHGLTGVDAGTIAETLFADGMVANMIVLGAAVQVGAIPISLESIEQAITLNGVAIEKNKGALMAGRLAVTDPESLASLLDTARHHTADTDRRLVARRERTDRLLRASSLDGEVLRLASVRIPELIAFQNASCAERYLALVEQARAAERRLGLTETRYSESVATYLFKLMAYKDEYEVARLHLDQQFRRSVDDALPGGQSLRYRLHPPILRSMGMRSKLALPPAVAVPAFRALHTLRHLRGTPMDVFGWTRIRRMERSLLREYEEMISDINRSLDVDTYGDAVALAALPDMVRGYEHVKVASVHRYRAEVDRLMARFHGAGA